MEEKNISKKQSEIEKKIYEYYQQTVEERMKKEISLDADEVTLEGLKKNIAIYKEQADDLALFTPKLNSESEKQKREQSVKEKCQLEEVIEWKQEEIQSYKRQEENLREIMNWVKSLPLDKINESKGESEENSESEKLKMLQVQEMERKRIASELHDTAAQSLIAVYNKMELCYHLIDIDSIRAKLEIQTTKKYIKDIIAEIRETIYNLRPMSFDDIGLDTTLSQLVDKIKNDSHIGVSMVNQEILEECLHDNLVKLTLFRILHEACINVVKHAKAKTLSVLFEKKDNILSMVIEDDGVGFDVILTEKGQEKDNLGYGIPMMRERVYLLSGTMQIESRIGIGTKITINIPLLEEDKYVCKSNNSR